jgi:hypothetical protein
MALMMKGKVNLVIPVVDQPEAKRVIDDITCLLHSVGEDRVVCEHVAEGMNRLVKVDWEPRYCEVSTKLGDF